MRRRRFMLGIVVVLAALCGVAFLALRAREPSYQGKPLSRWLADLDSRQPAVQAAAVEAVHQMGTNSLPWLVRMIQKRDSRLKMRLLVAMSQRNIPGTGHVKTAAYAHYKACRAFRVLGRAAEPAVPAVVAALGDGPAWLEAGATLPWLGPTGVSAFTNALARARGQHFMHASMALFGYIREVGSGATPSQDQELILQSCAQALIPRLADQDFSVRDVALSSLEHLHLPPEVLVPALTNNLARQDLVPHWSELEALGRLGPGAKAAVPALVRYGRAAQVKAERLKVIEVLEKIDPDAAMMIPTN